MKSEANQIEASKQRYETLALAWKEDFDKSIEAVLQDPTSTLDRIIDVVFEKGILDRVASLNPEFRELRESLNRVQWKGDRSDPELYKRIIYSCEHLKIAIRESHTITGGYTVAAYQTFAQIMTEPELRARFLSSIDYKQTAAVFFDKIAEKAREKLLKIGDQDQVEIVPLGSQITFHGISAKVARYTGDGEIVFEPKTFEDHKKLGEYTDYTSCVSPQMLTKDNFKIIR